MFAKHHVLPLATVLAALSCQPVIAETPLSLKGIQMGDSREKVEQILGEPTECNLDERVESYQFCSYAGMTFGGDYGVDAWAIFFQGRVYKVQFNFEWGAEDRLNLVAEKYGRPKVCTNSNKCHLTIERLPLRLTSYWSGGVNGDVSLMDHDVSDRVHEIRYPPPPPKPPLDKDDI